jgi:hypothetical protein
MFKRIVIAIVISLFVVQTFANQTAGEWQKLVAPDNSCSVLLPSMPEKQKDTKDTKYGTVLTQIWLSRVTNGIYVLGITDYPIDVDPKTELDLDRDNFLKEVNAKLVDESPITLSGTTGKEFTGVSDAYTFKSRVYLIGRRVYQIIAGEQTASVDANRVAKFLGSFELAKKTN